MFPLVLRHIKHLSSLHHGLLQALWLKATPGVVDFPAAASEVEWLQTRVAIMTIHDTTSGEG